MFLSLAGAWPYRTVTEVFFPGQFRVRSRVGGLNFQYCHLSQIHSIAIVSNTSNIAQHDIGNLYAVLNDLKASRASNTRQAAHPCQSGLSCEHAMQVRFLHDNILGERRPAGEKRSPSVRKERHRFRRNRRGRRQKKSRRRQKKRRL